ncbi:MAG: hypothetical protein ACJ74D_05425 [Gaiellaceae bacterium]
MPDLLSATVLLRPAGGGSAADYATAETADRLLPDPQAAEQAQAYFRDAGFDVTAAFGPTFSIVASRELFERTFATRLKGADREGVTTEEGAFELPLPADLGEAVEAVTFTPPPDFGPTEYS